MEKIRILFTIPNFITAGSGRAMLNVVQRLDPNHYQPTICVSRLGGPLCDEVVRLGIPLVEAPFTVSPRPLLSLPLRVWRCARGFRRYGFDIWHSFHYLDDYTEPLIARMSGARAWVYTKKNMNWWHRSWYLRTWLATRVACQNTTMIRKFFVRKSFKAKASLVAPGVDHNLYRPGTEGRLRIRESLGLASDVCVVGVVAHLVPVKGHPLLIRAVAQVPGVCLWIAGARHDEEYSRSLEALAVELGVADRIHFLGGISDVPALLAELDIFVLSSLSKGEGCPIALLEAMSSGVACIATDVSGCDDVITDGIDGLLIPPENVDALADALKKLNQFPEMRQRLASAGRARIESHYTMQNEVSGYDSLYRSALGKAALGKAALGKRSEA